MSKAKKDKNRRLFSVVAGVLAAFIAFCLAAGAASFITEAAGGFSVGAGSLSIAVGGSSGFYVSASNAVGFFSVSTTGPVSAYISNDGFVDNSSAWVNVSGLSEGEGSVTVYAYQGASYDDEDLTGWSRTIYVSVYTPAPSSGGENSGGSDYTYETVYVPEPVKVEIDGKTYSLTENIEGFWAPEGFVFDTTVYTNEAGDELDIEYMTWPDSNEKFFVLKDEESGDSAYYELAEGDDLSFKRVAAIVYADTGFWVKDLPEELTLPEGYKKTEIEISGTMKQALALDPDAFAEYLKNDPNAAFYPKTAEEVYVLYGFAFGEYKFYRYDTRTGTIQPQEGFLNMAKDETDQSEPEIETETTEAQHDDAAVEEPESVGKFREFTQKPWAPIVVAVAAAAIGSVVTTLINKKK